MSWGMHLLCLVICGNLAERHRLVVDLHLEIIAVQDSVFHAGGVKTAQLPPRPPNLNAHLEWFYRSIKEEGLDHFVICSEEQLALLVWEYCKHDPEERPNQGLANRLISGKPPETEGAVARHRR